MTGESRKRPHGQIRQSQIVTTFGPGSMVDLKDYAALIGGLDVWSRPTVLIDEERLTAKVREILGNPTLRLYAPPIDSSDPKSPPTGVTCWQFPRWFIVQHEEEASPFRARRLVHLRHLDRGKFEKRPVVPVRFVRACPNGHIEDIDWRGFAHGYKRNDCRQQLWIEERGTSGDLAEIYVKCECGESNSLARATHVGERQLGDCDGARPWLGPNGGERCGGTGGAQPNRLLIRTASNAYFPQTLSVISIPDKEAALRRAVDSVWEDFLQTAEDAQDVKRDRRKPKVAAALEGFSDDEVFAEIQRRRGVAPDSKKKIKQAEMETLLSAREETGEDVPEGDWYAKAFPLPKTRPPLLRSLERVVLVHRLREVTAQVGFTRFEASSTDVDGELRLGVQRAHLALETRWVPAVENRGEGGFLAFSADAIAVWAKRERVEARGRQLRSGFTAWQKAHTPGRMEFPGLPFVFLHSLSHLLITAVSLECGYSASSIRERIYAGESGYGILLFTGTPDSEGTLGGLVQVGQRMERFLRAALDLGRLCSNDPVCAEHVPANRQEERFLHGAACHGCLLIAETCCEKRNDFLDRALVVPTVGEVDASFFSEDDL